tara:strand:+ start:5004 stop:5660 length:657 start_codon:yes stop_codon:yes gene_type:complete
MYETNKSEEAVKHSEMETAAAAKMQQKSLRMYGVVALVVVLILGAILYTQGFIVAAKVNGESISRLSVIGELENQAGAAVLDSMILDILLEQAAAEANVVVTDLEVASEIAAIKSQISEQGGTLEDLLAQQGLTRESLAKQIKTQKILAALLLSDISVTEEEINAFIEANGPFPEGQAETLRPQIEEQIKNQKFNTAAQSYITGLRTQANIQYFVDYE